jgi:CheY-like chemotaxis protein
MVLMDHMMPEMDGVEATNEIRKLGGRYKQIAIIALTANAIKGAEEMFLENGFNDLVTKPIEIRDLNMALEKWLPPEKIMRKEESTEPEAAKLEKLPDNPVDDEDKEITFFLDILGHIPEINAEIGLSHFSRMKKLYYESVALFHKKLLAECEKMSGFLNASDISNFSISVHAMKSILATIGAVSMSELALKLETASKKKEYNFCVQYFPELREKLLSLYESLSLIFTVEKDDIEKEKGDTAYLHTHIAKALTAIDDFNNDAGIEAINNLLAYDFGDETNVLLEKAMAAFRNYDFDGAAETLEAIK